MPRNSSVDNFWYLFILVIIIVSNIFITIITIDIIIIIYRMLVDMGDLPQPDQHVLSETLWQGKEEGGITNNNNDNNHDKKRAVSISNPVKNNFDETYNDAISEEMKIQKKLKIVDYGSQLKKISLSTPQQNKMESYTTDKEGKKIYFLYGTL